MNTMPIPSELAMTLEEACALSSECWRLGRIAEQLKDSKEGAGIRHAVRRITKILEELGIGVVDFAGRAYDPGMVPEVIEVQEFPGVPDGQAVVQETITPTVTLCGQVVKSGQIIVKRSPVGPQQYREMPE
jgi:hypothetical protein